MVDNTYSTFKSKCFNTSGNPFYLSAQKREITNAKTAVYSILDVNSTELPPIGEHKAEIRMGSTQTFSLPQIGDTLIGVHMKIVLPHARILDPESKKPVEIRWRKNLRSKIFKSASFELSGCVHESHTINVMRDYNKYFPGEINTGILTSEPRMPKYTHTLYGTTLDELTFTRALNFWFSRNPIVNSQSINIPGALMVSLPYGKRKIEVVIADWDNIIKREDGKPVRDEDVEASGSIKIKLLMHTGNIHNDVSEAVLDTEKYNIPILSRFLYENKDELWFHGTYITTNVWMDIEPLNNSPMLEFMVLHSPVKAKCIKMYPQFDGEKMQMSENFEYYEYDRKRKEHVYVLDRRLSPLHISRTGHRNERFNRSLHLVFTGIKSVEERPECTEFYKKQEKLKKEHESGKSKSKEYQYEFPPTEEKPKMHVRVTMSLLRAITYKAGHIDFIIQ
jgi:hypothetical protein